MAPLEETRGSIRHREARERVAKLANEKDELLVIGLWLLAELDATPWWRPLRRKWLESRWLKTDRQRCEVGEALASAEDDARIAAMEIRP